MIESQFLCNCETFSSSSNHIASQLPARTPKFSAFQSSTTALSRGENTTSHSFKTEKTSSQPFKATLPTSAVDQECIRWRTFRSTTRRLFPISLPASTKPSTKFTTILTKMFTTLHFTQAMEIGTEFEMIQFHTGLKQLRISLRILSFSSTLVFVENVTN